MLWLSGCDKLLASGATAACWDHSDTDACSLSGDVARGVWRAVSVGGGCVFIYNRSMR